MFLKKIEKSIETLDKNLNEKMKSVLLQKESFEDLETKISQFKNELEIKYQRLEITLEKKLLDMHQSYNEKLFTILESFLRWNKEISLVSYLGGKEPDLKKLKFELMRPMMEESWAKTNAEQSDKINKALNSKGEKIRIAWGQYKEDLLVAEREGRDTLLIKSKLEVLEKLMEGI